jgi:prepilin-type N-terminal cleavage/methylation domain-containing protein
MGQEKMKQIIKKCSPRVDGRRFLQVKKISTTKSGFSLIEALVAIFVFSIVAVMLAVLFSGFLKNYNASKKTQRSAENTQYVINLMAKTIRGSILLPGPAFGDASQITMFDTSRSMCVIYKYETGVLKMSTAGDNGITIADVTKCNTTAAPMLAIFSELTKFGEVSKVSFTGIPSTDGPPRFFGKVLISANIAGSNSSTIQTTVSLRQ